MTIADIGSLSQLWTLIVGGLGGLTLAGIGKGVAWFWNLRKANQELKKVEAENTVLKHQAELREAVVVLRGCANVLLLQSNLPSLSRAEWASCLKDQSLINEALVEARAEREPGTDDRWIIRFSPAEDVGRFN